MTMCGTHGTPNNVRTDLPVQANAKTLHVEDLGILRPKRLARLILNFAAHAVRLPCVNGNVT